jgi:hypothetical protein
VRRTPAGRSRRARREPRRDSRSSRDPATAQTDLASLWRDRYRDSSADSLWVTDLIMQPARERGAEGTANGSTETGRWAGDASEHLGRHVGLDKMCLLMEVRVHKGSENFAK